MRLGKETQTLDNPVHTPYELLAKIHETGLKMQKRINDIIKKCELSDFVINMLLVAYVTTPTT